MMCSILQKRVKNAVEMKNHSTTSFVPKSIFPKALTNTTLVSIPKHSDNSPISSKKVGWYKTPSLAIISMPKL